MEELLEMEFCSGDLVNNVREVMLGGGGYLCRGEMI